MVTPDEQIVFIDIETAGLDIASPILQVAAVAVNSQLREVDSFEAKLRFDMRRIRPRYRTMCAKYRKTWRNELKAPRAAATELARFLSRHATVDMVFGNAATCRVAQLAAHNAAHDGPFLHALFDRTRRFLPAHPRMLCTIQRATWLFAEDQTLRPPADFKLSTLCRYFGIPLRPGEAHDALVDARATAALYRAMVRRTNTQGKLEVA